MLIAGSSAELNLRIKVKMRTECVNCDNPVWDENSAFCEDCLNKMDEEDNSSDYEDYET